MVTITRVIILFVVLCVTLTNAVSYKHVILTPTGNGDEMVITWTSDTDWDSVNPPNVRYCDELSCGTPLSVYATNDDVTMFHYSGVEHPFGVTEYIIKLKMTGLTPGGQHLYSLYHGDDLITGNLNFQALPAFTDDNAVVIALYGDMGENAADLAHTRGGLYNLAGNKTADLIVHYGDFGYNLCSKTGNVGSSLLDNMELITSSIPYLTTNGNHELDNKGQGDMNIEFFSKWFTNAQRDIAENSDSHDPNNLWYSIDVNLNVHIIVLSTEVYCQALYHTEIVGEYKNITMLELQYNWLIRDLNKVTQDNTLSRIQRPWIIVTGHRQMYLGTEAKFHADIMKYGIKCPSGNCREYNEPCLNRDNPDECLYSLEALFNEYHVDMAYMGHMHDYWRMYPIAPGTGSNSTHNGTGEYENYPNQNVHVNPSFPIYIVSGAVGVASDAATDWPGFSCSFDKIEDDQGVIKELTTLVPVSLGSEITVTASSYSASTPVTNLLNGGLWNSGDYTNGEAYVLFDLKTDQSVNLIELTVVQSPSPATTRHEIYGRRDRSPTEFLVKAIEKSTTNGEKLTIRPSTSGPNNAVMRYLRIKTVSSPSWIAWESVHIYSNPDFPGLLPILPMQGVLAIEESSITVTASSYDPSAPVENLLSGGSWNSGNYASASAPAYVLFDFHFDLYVDWVSLKVEQSPVSASTIHEIWGAAVGSQETLLYTISGTTTHGQIITFSPRAHLRYLRIKTTNSPSWVAWSHIEVWTDPADVVIGNENSWWWKLLGHFGLDLRCWEPFPEQENARPTVVHWDGISYSRLTIASNLELTHQQIAKDGTIVDTLQVIWSQTMQANSTMTPFEMSYCNYPKTCDQ